MKLETKKDIWDTTPRAKFGWYGTTGRGLRREGIFRYFLWTIIFLYTCAHLQVTPEDRSRPFMAQNACFRVR